MQHLLVLLSIFPLCIGAGTLFVLGGRWLKSPSVQKSWTFFFFLNYSFLLVIAAVTAYLLTNTGASERTQLFSGCLTLVAMGLLEVTFSGMMFSQGALSPGRGAVMFVGVSSVSTLLTSVCLLFVSLKNPLIFILIAFFFFFAVIIFNLIHHFRYAKIKKPRFFKTGAALYSLVCIGAIAESLFYINAGKTFISISLPIAYLLSSLQFLMAGNNLNNASDSNTAARAIAEGFSLTPRESDIARQLLAGMSNKEIAYELGISQHTVRNHIYNLYQKLNIQKRMDLVRLASKMT